MDSQKRLIVHARILEKQPLLAVLVLCVIGFCVYANSFDGAFVFDDERTIVHNKHLEELVSAKHFKTRRPVVRLSLALNYAFGQLNTWGYHLVNILIHVAAATLLYDLTRRTLRLAEPLQPVSSRVAFVATLLWVVHPLQTESVTYIIQRAESLMALFYLAAIYCVLRGHEGRTRTAWYILAIVSCALAMASKAVAVTAPLAVLLYDRFFLARSFAAALRARLWLYVGLAGTFGVLAVTGVLLAVLSPKAGQVVTVGFAFAAGPEGFSAFEYLLRQPAAILRYLQLALLPHGQCVDYSWTLEEVPIALPVVTIVALLALTGWGLRRAPQIAFLSLFFFLVLAPTSSFIPIRDLIFEHRVYLPLAAFTLLVSLGGYRALRQWVPANGRPLVCWIVVVGAVGALSWATVQRNRVYESPLTFWSDVVTKRPENPRAHEQLAPLYYAAGQRSQGWHHLERASQLSPTNISVDLRLAQRCMEEGRVQDALPHVEKAVKFFEADGDRNARNFFRPKRAHAYCLYASILTGLDRAGEALPHFEKGLSANRCFIDGLMNQAWAFGKLQRFDEARRPLLKLLRCVGDDGDPSVRARATIGLARCELALGNQAAAAEWVQKTLAIEPNNGEAVELQGRLKATPGGG